MTGRASRLEADPKFGARSGRKVRYGRGNRASSESLALAKRGYGLDLETN